MKKNIYILYGIALLQGMVFYGPIATLYRQVHGLSVFQITLIEGISLASCLLLEVPWGMVADKIGYRKTIIFCSWLYFVSKIVFWQATDFSGFLVERLMLSVILAGLSGVDTSILYLSNQGKGTQKTYGIYDAMGMLGLLIAAGIFSVMIKDNYALAGLLTAISYGFAALLSLGIKEVKPTKTDAVKEEPFKETFQKTFHNKTLVLFLVAVALLSETHQTITVFLNQVKYETCGLNDSAIGMVYMVATSLGLLGICSASVTRRMGLLRSLLLFSLLSISSCLVLGFTKSAFPAVLGILTLRLSNTLFQPFQAEIQNRQIETQNRATALSIHSMLISVIAIGTNLVFGILSDWNLPAAFCFGGCISLLSLALFVLWFMKTYRIPDCVCHSKTC